MLQHTFCHLPGIGAATERKLLEAGINSWDDALQADKLPLKPGLQTEFISGVQESKHRLQAGDALWFSDRLPNPEQWRLYPHFQHTAAFVDIETSGLRWPEGNITTIALYDGSELKVYVQGRNLDEFVDDIAKYKLLVTWNGRCFDAPFIRRALSIPLQMAHLDLYLVFRACGIKGGLKKVEKQLGLDRENLNGVDGYTAILLWKEYLSSGSETALETLLAYNAEDVFSLEILSRHICTLQGARFKGQVQKPANPFRADKILLQKLAEYRAQYNY